MPYDAGLIDRVFYVRWQAGLRGPGDLENIITNISNHRKSSPKPLVFLNVLTAEADVLGDPDPQAIDRFAVKVREFAEHTYVVVEGQGFKTAALRSRITSNWRRRQEQGFATLHTSTEEALKRIAADHALDEAALLRTARERGLLGAHD